MWKYAENGKDVIQDDRTAPLTRLSDVDNRVSVEVQAIHYVHWIIENDKTDLYFYPLKKRPHAHANMVRRIVLSKLVEYGGDTEPSYRDGFDYKRQMDRLMTSARAMGFAIHECIPVD